MNTPLLAALRDRLDTLAPWIAPLGLRLLLAWEYFESGREKLRGDNWFAELQQDFPFPFDLLPASLNWQLATGVELLGALCLLLGLGTRLAAGALLGLTVVATATAHWPMQWQGLGELAMGYAITDQGFGNFKLPLLFIAMLLPLFLHGPGRCSIDALLVRHADPLRRRSDPVSWGALLLLAAVPVGWLLPGTGLALMALGAGLLAWAWHRAASRGVTGTGGPLC